MVAYILIYSEKDKYTGYNDHLQKTEQFVQAPHYISNFKGQNSLPTIKFEELSIILQKTVIVVHV